MKNSLLEYEYNLLGAYCLNQDLFEGVEHLVSSNIFSLSVNKFGYKVVKGLHERGINPDVKVVYAEIHKSPSVITEEKTLISHWTQSYLSPDDVSYYVTTLFSEYVSRYLAPKLQQAHAKLTSNSVDSLEVLEEVKSHINDIELVLNNVSKEKSSSTVFDEALQRILDLKNNVIQQNGFSFGLKELDERTGGINVGMNVLAATPGGGKTSMLINIIMKNTIDNDYPVLFFSLEMPSIEIMTNVISNYAEINSRALREGSVDDMNIENIRTLKERIKENFIIDDTGGVTWQYIEAKIKAFRKKYKIPANKKILVLIDYLQLMTSSADEKRLTTEEQIGTRCNELTRISKNQNCATVLLSQFSRMEKERKVPRPKMSDLKGSGAIEACAILILLLFRPEYHDIFTDDKGRDLRGLCEINPVKGRYIKPVPVYARFEGRYSKFSDYIPDDDIKTDAKEAF